MIVAPLHHSRGAVVVGLWLLLRLFLELDSEVLPGLRWRFYARSADCVTCVIAQPIEVLLRLVAHSTAVRLDQRVDAMLWG
jgi:hypothetical protein